MDKFFNATVDDDSVGYSRRRGQGQAQQSEGKPCRACTDFKSFLKAGGPSVNVTEVNGGSQNKTDEKAQEALQEKEYFSRCPLDVAAIGNRTWGFLHTMSVYLPEGALTPTQSSEVSQFMQIFSRIYPCDHCASDFRTEIKKEPPVVDTGKNFAQWLCRQHNQVNRKLGKPEFNCNLIYERWRDGPKDGSCD